MALVPEEEGVGQEPAVAAQSEVAAGAEVAQPGAVERVAQQQVGNGQSRPLNGAGVEQLVGQWAMCYLTSPGSRRP